MNLVIFILALSVCIIAACAAGTGHEQEFIAKANMLMSQTTMRSPFTTFFQTGNCSLTIRNVEAFLQLCDLQSLKLGETERHISNYPLLKEFIHHLHVFTQESREWTETEKIGDGSCENLVEAHLYWAHIQYRSFALKRHQNQLSSSSNGESSLDYSLVQFPPTNIAVEVHHGYINELKEETRRVLFSLVETCHRMSSRVRFDCGFLISCSRLEQQNRELLQIFHSLRSKHEKFRTLENADLTAKYYELLYALATILDTVHGLMAINGSILDVSVIHKEEQYFRREMGAARLEMFLIKSSIVSDIFSLLEDI